MSHEEQTEWPSFTTVLRDVAPDSPTARSLASADERAHFAAAAEAIRAKRDEPKPGRRVETEPEQAREEATVLPASTKDSGTSGFLPEPLQPLEIDTDSIRALLEPLSESVSSDELDALSDLPAPVEFPELSEMVPQVEEAPEPEPEIPDTLSAEIQDDHVLVFELDDAEMEQVDAANELEEPVPLLDPFADESAIEPFSTADIPSTELGVPEISDSDLNGGAFMSDPLLQDPFGDISIDLGSALDPVAHLTNSPSDDVVDFDLPVEPSEISTIVDVDQLDMDTLETIELPDSIANIPGIELPEMGSAPVEVFEDLAPMAESANEAIADVHELTAKRPPANADIPDSGDLGSEAFDSKAFDTETFDTAETAESVAVESEPDAFNPDPLNPDPFDTDTFNTASSDLFELDLDNDPATAQLGSVDLSDLYGMDEFDSVAAADQIETDLDELIEFKEEETNNVIPLHREPSSHANTEPPPSSRDADESIPENLAGHLTGNTGWVGVPAAPDDVPDPWAHMRPSEEPKKQGFWANRPKFFGGDERRKRKAERRADDHEPTTQAMDVSFDKECPRCGSDCKVDLDDPIGRRVHVSCPSCQHIWYTPYVLEESQAG